MENDRSESMLNNTNAVSHGVHSAANRPPALMNPLDVQTLTELRDLIRSGDGRIELRLEIIARLTLVARKFFADISRNQSDPAWWNSGVVRVGGSYLSELRRWVDSMPPDREAIDVPDLSPYRSDTDASNR